MDHIHVHLFQILRGYGNLTPPRSLVFPSDLPFRLLQDFLLERILLSTHFMTYPPSRAYQRIFWKWAIQHLETRLADPANKANEECEVDDRVYARFLSLATSEDFTAGKVTAPEPSYLTYFWRDDRKYGGNSSLDKADAPGCLTTMGPLVDLNSYHTVTLLESRNLVEAGTTGLTTWGASFVLASYLVSHSDILDNQNVLDLGCGAGFLGIVVAQLQVIRMNCWMQSGKMAKNPVLLGGMKMTLTDVNQEVLARAQSNVALPCNLLGNHAQIAFKLLDWNEGLVAQSDPKALQCFQSQLAESSADLILGADIVYDPSLVPPLIETLRLALERPDSTALIALTVRNTDTMMSFLHQAADKLVVELVTRAPEGHLVVADLNYSENVHILRICARVMDISPRVPA